MDNTDSSVLATDANDIVERIKKSLLMVEDPELGVNVVDLGMIYEIKVEGEKAFITMTLTTIGCPMHAAITNGVKNAAQRTEGITEADVTLTFDPPWEPELMSEYARSKLG